MFFRKLYLKIRLYLYSIRDTISQLVILTLAGILLYAFLNGIVINKFILGKAYSEQIKKNYSSAISYYNLAYSYFKIDHYSKENQKMYFEIPYRIALCYLAKNDKQNAIKTMLDEVVTVQGDYGLFSRDSAFFVRKYLIDFYLINNCIGLANREFNNLLFIYKSIGYDDSSLADVDRLLGDLYYQQKDYDNAMISYQKAFESYSKLISIDYEIYVRMVSRMGDYFNKQKQTDLSVKLYQKALELISSTGGENTEYNADLLLKLGDIYIQQDNKVKDAIKCYEQAISIIKGLWGATYNKQNLIQYLTTLKGLYDQDNQYTKSRAVELELARMRRFSFVL